MAVKGWLAICAFIAVGGVAGAAAIIASTEFNRRTSPDAVCTSCHSMATLTADPHFQQSAHEVNAAGILVGCSDCHIESGSWFIETYVHVTSAVKDVIAEYTHNFDDPALWQKRRIELATKVRDEMRRNDSITCRKCHNAAAIRPTSEAGRSAHAMLQQRHMTCIDCHSNIVHTPARPLH
jgi:nitrate/TMAO reductase-like tetraheme cytochrome c subunit